MKRCAEARERATALYGLATNEADKLIDDDQYDAAFDAATRAYARCAKAGWDPRVPFVIE
jgi:hypothetical protein